ncbi:MAG: glutamine synthetase [Motiliproteus sp.]|jgi:glutamine synthetase
MEAFDSFLKENRIIEIESMIPDMTGNARGKFYPLRKFLAEESGRIPESVLIQTVTGDSADNAGELVHPSDRDMMLVPDLSTLRLVPWAEEPTAQIINDCCDMDGNLHPLASRGVLRRVLKLYEAEGITPVIAPELEFYLLETNTDPDNELKSAVGRSGRRETSRQSYSIDAVNEFNPVIDTLYQYCEKQGLDVDILIHEVGAAQMEINFLHGDPMNLADQVFVFKRTLREAALKHGIYATFMAKPMEHEPGSSMHIHQSMVDSKTGANIFVAEDGGYSETFYHYMGGLQRYVPHAISFFAPNVNSYRRFVPGNAAPVNTHWGIDNRTAGLRTPASPPEATRIENRFPGADANPYLSIALTLACGYLGMKEKITPSAPIEGETFAPGDKIEVARTLEEGLRCLDECEPLKEILGEHFVKAYIGVKLAEFETFNQVISSWEREHLLLNV